MRFSKKRSSKKLDGNEVKYCEFGRSKLPLRSTRTSCRHVRGPHARSKIPVSAAIYIYLYNFALYALHIDYVYYKCSFYEYTIFIYTCHENNYRAKSSSAYLSQSAWAIFFSGSCFCRDYSCIIIMYSNHKMLVETL